MTFLAPAFLMAAAAISAAVIALHFITTREPTTTPLPTARFAPDLPIRASSRALRLQDLLLLLLRVLFIFAVGAALAEPVIQPRRRAAARIVLVDRSRAVANAGEVADSATALLRDGDALVLFADSARTVRDGSRDTLASLVLRRETGRLSTALVRGLRAASALRDAADSLEMVIVSPLASEELDDATDSLRALWPGAVKLVRVAARADSAARRAVRIDGAADDPLRFALDPSTPPLARDTLLVVRGSLTADDSAWVATGGGRTLVYWPAVDRGIAVDAASGAPALPPSWRARAASDTVGAVVAGNAVVVAPFARWATFSAAGDSAAPGDSAGSAARVIARWVDGEPAAVEYRYASGCIRTVTVPVPTRGDLVLSPRFARFTAAMLRPCGADAADLTPASEVRLSSLSRAGRPELVSRDSIVPAERVPTPLVPWLYAAALLSALGALVLRRRATNAAPRAAEERA